MLGARNKPARCGSRRLFAGGRGSGEAFGGHLPAGYEFTPSFLAVEVRVDDVVVADARLSGLAHELHLRLLRGTAGLAVVTGLAGGDEVVPGVATAAVARHDVIEREIALAVPAAVLAGVAVAVEDLA